MIAHWISRASDAAGHLAAGAWQQLAGTLLRPGSTFSIGALALSLLVFVAIAVPRRRAVRVELLRRLLVPRRQFSTASGRADAAYFVGGLFLAGAALGWGVISADAVRGGVSRLLGAPVPRLLPDWLAMTIATPLLFLAYEFAYWFDHWLKHRVAFLWQFHKVHHQAESLSLLTNGRIHPIDSLIFLNIVAAMLGLTQALLVKLLGMAASPLALGGTNALVMVTSVTITHLQHSHLWIGFGPRWGRWLLGPAHHQIHHSVAPEHFNRNLGNALTLFDRMAGTFHQPGARPADLRFGVDDAEAAPHGARALLVQPFVDAALLLAQPIARRIGRLRRRAATLAR